MKKENNNSKKIIWYSIAALVLTISGISLLVSGLHDSHKQTVIVAGFILLLEQSDKTVLQISEELGFPKNKLPTNKD